VPAGIRDSVVVIGAGPAGLAAAWELVRLGLHPVIVEAGSRVGGIARTEVYKGYRFDVGGHRFFTQNEEVQQLWEEMLGAEFLTVPRLSRIYYRGRFYSYPLELGNALCNLGPLESVRVGLSYVWAKLFPTRPEATFEHWVTNRFGTRLYHAFFGPYTEKVWGIPGSAIGADWAAQRIRGLSLRTTVLNAVLGSSTARSLIREFQYPRLGPGMMWERFAAMVEAHGGEVRMGTEAVAVRRVEGDRWEVVCREGGRESILHGGHVISSMPLPTLLARLEPAPPAAVAAAAERLRHRAMLVVGLMVRRAELFPDNWIYVHSPDVSVGRIQNFRNWSRDLVPDPETSSLGLEYFCSEDDALWRLADADLIDLAGRELTMLGLANASEVVDGAVIRQPKAYPVYDGEYKAHLAVIQEYFATVSGLQTIGRNGLHRYNNQDHSMLTGIFAARNLCGGRHDLWNVNTEASYHEERLAPEQFE